MRKYVVMSGISVINYFETEENDFKIPGQVVIDVTDVEPTPHIGWTLWNGQWSDQPILVWVGNEYIEHGFLEGKQILETPAE